MKRKTLKINVTRIKKLPYQALIKQTECLKCYKDKNVWVGIKLWYLEIFV